MFFLGNFFAFENMNLKRLFLFVANYENINFGTAAITCHSNPVALVNIYMYIYLFVFVISLLVIVTVVWS